MDEPKFLNCRAVDVITIQPGMQRLRISPQWVMDDMAMYGCALMSNGKRIDPRDYWKQPEDAPDEA